MTYTIEYAEAFPWKTLKKIPKDQLRIIAQAIEQKLTRDPLLFGKPLQHSLRGCRRLRVGDYRVIYTLEGTVVTIAYIGNRATVYQLLRSRFFE